MRAKDVGAGGWRHAHSSRSRWTDGRKSRAPVVVSLAAMEDSARKSGARVYVAGGWFLHWFLFRFLNRGWGRGLRRLGQSLLLPEEERAYQQHGCQQQSAVKNASVHNQLSRRWKRWARLLEAKLLHDRKLADNVRQKFQHQVAACVGRDGCHEGEPDDLGGNARFGIVGHNQSSGGGATANP
jgi:hypothetical protein